MGLGSGRGREEARGQGELGASSPPRQLLRLEVFRPSVRLGVRLLAVLLLTAVPAGRGTVT